MTLFALLFTLSAIGISETAYLIKKRKQEEAPVCVIGEGCYKVLSSKYNKIFGLVHNDLIGFLFYVVIAAATGFLVLEIEPVYLFDLAAKVLIGIAAVTSLILVYIQWRVLKAWCFWCVMSAVTVGLMGILILINSFL